MYNAFLPTGNDKHIMDSYEPFPIDLEFNPDDMTISYLSQSPLGTPSFLQAAASSPLQHAAAQDISPTSELIINTAAPSQSGGEGDDSNHQPVSGSQQVSAATEPVPHGAPMGSSIKSRKRKAPTLKADAWEPYKARVIELHINQGMPLQKVKEIIENEFNFTAEYDSITKPQSLLPYVYICLSYASCCRVRQYRLRITQWGFDKNVKPKEMKGIVRLRQRRRLLETDKGELQFAVRGREVDPAKIDRFMTRNAIPQSQLYSPSSVASTYAPGALPSLKVKLTASKRLQLLWTTEQFRTTPPPTPSQAT